MTQKRKIYLTLTIITGLFLVMIFGVIYPLISKIKSTSFDLIQKKEILEDLEKNQQKISRLEKEYQLIKPELIKIEQNLLQQPEKTLDFIVALEGIAQKSNNQYEIKPIEQPKKESSSSLDFQVSLWGNFPNLIRFLVYLENMPYLIEVTKIQIQRISQEGIIKKELTGLLIGDVATNLNIKVYTQ